MNPSVRVVKNSFLLVGFLCHSQFFLMQLNTKKHTLDLMRYVASAIKAFLDIDIMDVLISMGDDDLMDVVEFADDAVR